MFSLRFGLSHVSKFNCIYKILGRKAKFNAKFTGSSGGMMGWAAPRRRDLQKAIGFSTPRFPQNVPAGKRRSAEWPVRRQPVDDRCVETIFHSRGQLALARPQIDSSVMTLLATGIDVDAASHSGLIWAQDRVREGLPKLKLLLVPTKVNQVLPES